LYANRA
jgi:hypothetical protein